MRIPFPSKEFDEAVAAVCHGTVSEEQASGLNTLLRSDAVARDEYLLRVELHARLASETDLFVSDAPETNASTFERNAMTLRDVAPARLPPRQGKRNLAVAIALAACAALLLAGWWALKPARLEERQGATSKAVAMLNRVVDARWNQAGENPRLGAPLEPGWLRLESGLAQVVFYSGARVVIEGPAELELVSANEGRCRSGRLVAEVPPQAKGFRIDTPRLSVTDLGTSFGIKVTEVRTELHVFKGSVECVAKNEAVTKQTLAAGSGAACERTEAIQRIAANATGFTSLFDLQTQATAAENLRYDRWRAANTRLHEDSALLVHFDFEHATPDDWRLHNAATRSLTGADATIVGCQWIEGRWPGKPALEFRSVSDRVRLSVPGEFDALTLTAWVRVQGLDRKINSLFMSDGFEAGTVHWLIRNDGVLGVTVIGQDPGKYQIVTSPPVLALDQYGMWLHLAVVIDGNSKRVVHYLNGRPVNRKGLDIAPPYRVGTAELGNWNANGFPKDDPFMIRNFSGAMDEFCLFSRALSAEEIHTLYAEGKPQPEPVAAR